MIKIKRYISGFKDGQEINLRKDSIYYNQQFSNGQLLTGVIERFRNANPDNEESFEFEVRWSNGNTNNYRIKDVILDPEIIKYDATTILDETKIYLKQCNEITINGILDKLYSGENNKAQKTYWKTDAGELYLHCVAGKMRSYDDLYYLCKTYIDDLTHEEMIKSLLLYKQKDIFEITIFLYNCSTMNKIRYEFVRNKSFKDIYDTAIKVDKYDSLYSWKELFEMIGINSFEDFKEFYKQNLL